MKSLQIKSGKVYCYDPELKKLNLMGHKIGNKFFKTVESQHFMRRVGGYGFQYDAFAMFEQEGITEIEILERHTGNIWLSKPKEWFLHGHIADYGRGKQIFMSLKYMRLKNKEVAKKQYEEKESERIEKIQQSRMF